MHFCQKKKRKPHFLNSSPCSLSLQKNCVAKAWISFLMTLIMIYKTEMKIVGGF